MNSLQHSLKHEAWFHLILCVKSQNIRTGSLSRTATETMIAATSGGTPEEEQPLMAHRVVKRLTSIRVLVVTLLVISTIGAAGIGLWMFIGTMGRGGTSGTPFRLVNRSTWGAKMPIHTTPLPHPPATYAVIIHTASDTCDTLASCSAEVREIQKLHMDHKNSDDIAFSFLVGGDGQTYEGRGWDVQGAFARMVNNKSLGIAFIGNFDKTEPPKQQLEEAEALLEVSVKSKKLSSDYILVAHRQVSETVSPGEALFKILKTWPHWKDCYMESC